MCSLPSLRFRRLWTPERINSVLWLDASDSSTVSTSGSLVTEWRDKSGTTKNYTSVSGAEPSYTGTLNSRNIVTFNGGQVLRRTDSGLPTGNFTIAYIGRSNLNSPTVYDYQAILHYGSNDMGQALFLAYGTDMNFGVNAIGISQYGNTIGVSNATLQPILATGVRNSTTYSLRLNGGSGTASKVMTANTVLSGFSSLGGHNASLGGGFLNGYIGELLILNSVTSQATLETIEGYMAHKWGLTSTLPSNHPFKNYPPRGL